VLLSAGIEVDEIKLKSLVAAIRQINIDEIIKTATLIPTAVTVAPPQPQAQAQQAKPQAKEEEKKEEKKEVTEEELEQGLSALFG
jgi:large subunit ribosomal protein L12